MSEDRLRHRKNCVLTATQEDIDSLNARMPDLVTGLPKANDGVSKGIATAKYSRPQGPE